jgi:hypothetical protein
MRCALSQTMLQRERLVHKVLNIVDATTFSQWVMTDAMHDSTSNAYHTDVACTSVCCVYAHNSSAKVVRISTVSQEEHTITQTRQLECTKKVLPEVIPKGEYSLFPSAPFLGKLTGLNAAEVARHPTSSFEVHHWFLCRYELL